MIWKDVILDGFITKYKVSDTGIIINKETNTKVGYIKHHGYYRCTLNIKLSTKTIYITVFVHRIVATAFIPNPNDYPQVNHKDENRINNNINNLEWCTAEYNRIYGNRIKHLTIAGKRPITCIFGNKKAVYISAHQAAKLCNCHWVSIAKIVRGEKSSLYGSTWRVATKEESAALGDKYHIGDIIDFTPYKRTKKKTRWTYSPKTNKIII